MNQPLVSVLMTAYNREKYIAEAIESVMASTYQNWELIIVDDCSSDRTVEIARSYEAKENRIKVYVNEKNLGDYPNRNQAASYAKGKYLKYVDADDMIYPYGLEQLVYYMEQFPESGFGLCSLSQDIKRIFPLQLSPKEAYQRHYFVTPVFHKAPLSAIIRKEVFEQFGGFTQKRMVGDFEMWHKLSQTYSVVLMPHGIVWYRKHEEQEMNDYYGFIGQYYQISKKMLSDPECPLNEEERKDALALEKKKKAKMILHLLRQRKIGVARQIKRELSLNYVELLRTALR